MHSLSADLLSGHGECDKYLVKLVEKDIDWRALPSDNPVKYLCSIAVLCWPDYGIDELIIQILVVDVHLLKHLQSNTIPILATTGSNDTGKLI